MMTHHTLTQLKSMKLDGMARALEEQLALPAATELSFEERFGMLVDRERAWRDSRRSHVSRCTRRGCGPHCFCSVPPP